MVRIGEGSYSRGSDMQVFISNHKEQLWQGHFEGGPYNRSPTKQRPVKRIRLYWHTVMVFVPAEGRN